MDNKFITSLAKGNLGELLFERLALHSGWYVRYNGDQYRNIIAPVSVSKKSPKKSEVLGGTGEPDFKISRTKNFKEHLSVEVKFQKNFNRNEKSVHKKGTAEDVRVVLSPTEYAVYPKSKERDLKISKSNWKSALDILKAISPG